MKKNRRRKCRHCRELFRADPRNRHHQRYCEKPACRRASQQSSQHRWLAKASNRDYFHGPAHVERVRAWRAAHPGYWRAGAQRRAALQEDSLAQAYESEGKSGFLIESPLQEFSVGQPLVLMGLIAHLTGAALQEDIARSARGFRQLANDILGGTPPPESRRSPP